MARQVSAINEKYIKGPFKADFQGGIVFGPDEFHFADVRGWGHLKYVENGEKIQDANLQFMVDALNEKASGALKKAQEEIANLMHPEFGDLGRLQEENKKLRDLVSKLIGDTGPDLDAYLDGHVEIPDVGEMRKGIRWLGFYKTEVYNCLGPASGEINDSILDAYVQKVGIDKLPKELRAEYEERQAERAKEG